MDSSSFIESSEGRQFSESYRTKQFASQPSPAARSRFGASWSRWELDAQCRFTRLPQDEGFRLFTRGKMVPREAYLDPAGNLREDVLQRLWASGVSITMRRLEDYSNPALAIARQLEAFGRCPVQVNLYITPASGQGLGVHYDDHDVLVFQVHGAKTWDIYADDAGGVPATPTGVRPAVTPRVLTLESGGWVYVPKGMWHEVRNKADEPSIHFTISLHPLTCGRMLQEALERAQRADPAFNAPCPAGTTGYLDEIARCLAKLPAFIDPPENYYGEYHQLGVPVPAPAVPDRTRLDAADTQSRFAWNRGEVIRSADDLELNLAYRRRPLQLRPELGATIRWMVQRGAFRPAECESLDPANALLLSRFLANVGVLRLED